MSAENVVAALAQVMVEMPAISKGGTAAAAQGGYKYRGIEQITAVAAPLLAKHGVVFVPQVQALDTRDLIVNGKPWTDTFLTVRYRICGPGGPEDYIEAVVVGIGRDNTDKGANKALTQAFKYALTQVLCIGDSRDDVDAEHHEADARPRAATARAVDELKARVELLTPEQRTTFAAWKDDQGFEWPWTPAAVDAMHDELDKRAASDPPVSLREATGEVGGGESLGESSPPPDDMAALELLGEQTF